MKRTALLLTTAVVGYFAPTPVASAQHQTNRGTGPIVVQGPGQTRNTTVVGNDGGSDSRPRPQPSPPARIVPPTPPKPVVTPTPSPVAGHTAPPRQSITPLPTGPTSIPPMRTPTGPVFVAGNRTPAPGHHGPTLVTPPPSSTPNRPLAWATDHRTSTTPRVTDALSRTVQVTFRDRARGLIMTVVTKERDVPAAMARYRDWEYVATTALPNR